MPKSRHFEVLRKDLRQVRVADLDLVPGPGEVLLQVDKFALTANNITYAVFGDAMQYWNFFPAADGWGRVPVWGFAEVAESRHDAIRPGERVYGYLPMSTHVVVEPARVTAESFMDGAAHRRPLPVPYQLYNRCAQDPLYDPRHEDERALLQPLFVTSFLIEDFLSDNNLFGARQVVVASASSKTALGVAFLVSRNRPQDAQVIGLTSPRNTAFCESLGHYDKVVTYDALDSLPADVPTVFVDMAGDGKLLHRVHHRFKDSLKYSCIVGATHWEQRETQHHLPGAKPQFFFAPTQAQKRRKDWGPGGLETRFGAAFGEFLPPVKRWLQVRHGRGPEAVQSVYLEVLEGRSAPQVGHMLSLLP
jgi:hypothetical protein